jgi:hypothetical protein
MSSCSSPAKLDRHSTRELARRVCDSRDPHAALALLEHSIACRHTRIALLRYLDARNLKAPLAQWHHAYVESVSARLSHDTLHALVAHSWQRCGEHRPGRS